MACPGVGIGDKTFDQLQEVVFGCKDDGFSLFNLPVDISKIIISQSGGPSQLKIGRLLPYAYPDKGAEQRIRDKLDMWVEAVSYSPRLLDLKNYVLFISRSKVSGFNDDHIMQQKLDDFVEKITKGCDSLDKRAFFAEALEELKSILSTQPPYKFALIKRELVERQYPFFLATFPEKYRKTSDLKVAASHAWIKFGFPLKAYEIAIEIFQGDFDELEKKRTLLEISSKLSDEKFSNEAKKVGNLASGRDEIKLLPRDLTWKQLKTPENATRLAKAVLKSTYCDKTEKQLYLTQISDILSDKKHFNECRFVIKLQQILNGTLPYDIDSSWQIFPLYAFDIAVAILNNKDLNEMRKTRNLYQIESGLQGEKSSELDQDELSMMRDIRRMCNLDESSDHKPVNSQHVTQKKAVNNLIRILHGNLPKNITWDWLISPSHVVGFAESILSRDELENDSKQKYLSQIVDILRSERHLDELCEVIKLKKMLSQNS